MLLGRKLIIGTVCLVVFGLCVCAEGEEPSTSRMGLSCPYWDIEWVDAGGYCDKLYWGESPYHPHWYHELLSGEWGAAIYYDGVPTSGPKTMWLTDYFVVPDWMTNSNFSVLEDANGWNDPNNPVDGNDTGRSVIKNDEVEVTIDYEIADLGETGYSPLVYREPNESALANRSERYVLLQTYTIKNIKASGDVTGLEFYQMLHGHPAQEEGPVVHCTYETVSLSDGLESYTPYNAVHTVGNFRYDITQWNNSAETTKDHVDWVGFSSTVEPNVVECGYYAEDYDKPDTGTHVNIEDRNLSGQTYSYGKSAGAMGWYLADLGPGESVSVTVGFMFGTENWPIPTILTKTNTDPNNECVYPWDANDENYLTFEVRYDTNGYGLDEVTLIDYLPAGLDYYSSEPVGDYNSSERTVSWELGDLGEADSCCIEVVAKVNYYAQPCESVSNRAEMRSPYLFYAEATQEVNICSWGSEIIYVDKDANGGFNNGTRWEDAYIYLQDALTAARNCGPAITAIWVAGGTYKPVWDMGEDTSYKDETFELVEYVGLFGHFGGIGTYESSATQRDFSDANNETVLEGQIGGNYYDAVRQVVTASSIEDSIIDGFTIQGSVGGAGVYIDYSPDVSVVNCKLKGNGDSGVECENFSYPDIHNCSFMDNATYGLIATSSGQAEVSYCIFDGNSNSNYGVHMSGNVTLDISKCAFKDHAVDGIWARSSDLTVTDCALQENGGQGITMSGTDATVTDCLISNNAGSGIYAQEYGGSGCELTLENSVVCYSDEDGIELNDNAGTSITNNWIYNNGTYYASAGILFNDQSAVPLVRNNTIYGNSSYGIQSSEQGADPNIRNCIIYGNDSNDLYRENGTFDTVNYCCLQNAHGGNGNITVDPCFYDVGSDNYHLGPNSACIDAGDPNGSYGNETDIDGETRMFDGDGNNSEVVDMGADEFYWSPADFKKDGIVNFVDYDVLASAWQTQEPNVSLDGDNDVDYDDVNRFCEEWLWEPAWTEGVEQMMMMGGGGGDFGLEGMALEGSLEGWGTGGGGKDDLMLGSAMESLRARPERLASRSQKFYDITASTTISAKREAMESESESEELWAEHIEELIEWLEDMLVDEEVKEEVGEEKWPEYAEGIERIIESLKEELEE